jgi:nucleoside phosphorylase
MTRFIGIVCGLKSEARVAAGASPASRVRIVVAGANAERAAALAAGLCKEGATAIVSFGVSGALAPHLAPGVRLIGGQVVTATGEIFACDPAMTAALRRAAEPRGLPLSDRSGGSRGEGAAMFEAKALPHRAREGSRTFVEGAGNGAVLYGSDSIYASPEEKARLHRETGALAVDMESHGVARAARAAAIPFAAIRAIADPASRALPKAALNAVAPDGRTRVLATLLECAKRPRDLPALLQLGADSNRALNSLGRGLDELFGALLRLDF